jgi:hypothetical protein
MNTKFKFFVYTLLVSLAKPIKYFLNLVKPARLDAFDIVSMRANETSASYIESQLHQSLLFPRKQELWKFSISEGHPNGLHLEMGVFDGGSIKYFGRNFPDRQFYGFDSFIGLREAWAGNQFLAGSFDRKGKIPRVPQNVELLKGWFHETLPTFLNANTDLISFLHMDADTYESTVEVLSIVRQRLRIGSVIIFDEYLGFPNWQMGEFRAWKEFVTAHKCEYRYLGFTGGQAAIQITLI